MKKENSLKNFFYAFTKRVIDLTLGTLLLIVFSPIILITALAIKLETEGPIIVDPQTLPPRIGKGGKKFFLYKFRSMIHNAHQLLRTDPKLKKLYQQYKKNSFKLSPDSDPRITRVGRFIRRHSIDEVPQLINVLKGEMSLVGPRPYLEEELVSQQKKYPQSRKYVKKMLQVKPGITGLWQVSGRSEVNFDQRVKLDAQYAEKKSLILDMMILLKTPWIMISGKGAY